MEMMLLSIIYLIAGLCFLFFSLGLAFIVLSPVLLPILSIFSFIFDKFKEVHRENRQKEENQKRNAENSRVALLYNARVLELENFVGNNYGSDGFFRNFSMSESEKIFSKPFLESGAKWLDYDGHEWGFSSKSYDKLGIYISRDKYRKTYFTGEKKSEVLHSHYITDSSPRIYLNKQTDGSWCFTIKFSEWLPEDLSYRSYCKSY
ncbi:hypothetical protein [Anabaena sp. PCC 7108]|uniref:hypothetical protein n=1 Tax=Anabaena sp. PCC 7108 TaxID=163908 RepID=UPI00034D7576|nr:hypothetical protein [Anabaena sp. PCC 7108]